VPTDSSIDLFSKPVAAGLVPGLDDGRPPRGLTKAGWVRTTGWLQVGHHPVSSAHIAAFAGLLWSLVGAAAVVTSRPVVAGVVVITTPAVCGVSWWLFTVLVRPASSARNNGTKRADEQTPGDLIRLYGSLGPVGQVVAVTSGEELLVTLHGGSHRTWARDHVLHVVELLS
jgi:hypothetical protein